jgi:hypothetical protein
LVAGPIRIIGRVYICDRCAAQTIEIMERHSGQSSRQKATKKSLWSRFFATVVAVVPSRPVP